MENKKVLIRCHDISKSYEKNNVIRNFSFDFCEDHLYLILGESGCGKTTLLNILTGTIFFDKGSISVYNYKFAKQVSLDFSRENIAYITQNTHFIDYLTVKDNLELCLNKIEDSYLIQNYLKEFQLSTSINKYPSQLSGGERQRIAIIQALLKEQKIIIFDEPTASLDLENKIILSSILKKLKKDHVIICATHDESMKEVADEIIDFNHIENYQNSDYILSNYKKIEVQKKFLFSYMVKQLFDKKREKKSEFLLVLILFLILLLFFASANYKEKLLESLVSTYQVNVVQTLCSIESGDYCQSILEKYHAVNFTYNYAENIPIPDDLVKDGYLVLEFDGTLRTLPYEKNLFPIADQTLLFGNYYTSENEIILGYKAASSLSENPQDLIGTKISIKLPDKEEEFTICGIFKYLPDNDIYLQSMYGDLDYNMYSYINSKYLEKYLYDDVFGHNELHNDKATSLYVYFNNSKDLMHFYHDFVGKNIKENDLAVRDFSSNFIDYQQDIEVLKLFSYPVIILAFLSALIFYFQTKNIQNHYKGYILSVYYYYGYEWNKILKTNLIVSFLSVISKYIIAVILAIIFVPILNIIVSYFNLFDFQLFSIDIMIIIYLLVALIVLSFLFTMISLIKQKKKGWLRVIEDGDDLL